MDSELPLILDPNSGASGFRLTRSDPGNKGLGPQLSSERPDLSDFRCCCLDLPSQKPRSLQDGLMTICVSSSLIGVDLPCTGTQGQAEHSSMHLLQSAGGLWDYEAL